MGSARSRRNAKRKTRRRVTHPKSAMAIFALQTARKPVVGMIELLSDEISNKTSDPVERHLFYLLRVLLRRVDADTRRIADLAGGNGFGACGELGRAIAERTEQGNTGGDSGG